MKNKLFNLTTYIDINKFSGFWIYKLNLFNFICFYCNESLSKNSSRFRKINSKLFGINLIKYNK